MVRRTLRPLAIVGLLGLLVAGCQAPTAPSPRALLGDGDLAAATVLAMVDLDPAGTAPERRVSPGLDVAPMSAPRPARLSPTQAGAGEAHLVVAERREVQGVVTYRVVLYEDTDEPVDGLLVYEGSTPVQSVAVDAAGDVLLLSAGQEDARDVYFLDLGGAFGPEETLYVVPNDADDTDVSVSLDGSVWMYSTAVLGVRGAHVLVPDTAAGEVGFTRVRITYDETPIDVVDPSLSGDGSLWVVATHDPLIQADFGGPILIAGATLEDDCCSVPLYGPEGAEFADPAFDEGGDALVTSFEFEGDRGVLYADLTTNVVFQLFEDAVDHAHLSGGGDVVVYARGGQLFRATLAEGTLGPVPTSVLVEASEEGFQAFAPYVARVAGPPVLPPGSTVYTGSTAGGPTFDRPDPEFGYVPGVRYHAQPFTVERSGYYLITSEQAFDGYLLLYTAPFDPEDPYDGLLAFNDDYVEPGLSRLYVLLEPGDYVLVTTGWGPGDFGGFENTVLAPPVVTEGDPPLVQDLTLDLSVAGTSDTVTATWYVLSALPIGCTLDWGDGTSEAVACSPGSLDSATHVYTDEGARVVTLTVSNMRGESVAKAFLTVHDPDPDAFDVVVVFANDLLSPTQMAAFQAAADRWAEVIVGDLPDVPASEVFAGMSCIGEPAFQGHIDDVVIVAAGAVIDGVNGVLAQAGPCFIREDGTNGDLTPLPTYGVMQFDVADLDALESEGGLFSTILHEMGHVLGIGTLWSANALVDYEPSTATCVSTPSFTVPPVFVGANAVAAYGSIGGTGAPPVEDGYGPGTKCAHWDEETFEEELMTGFLDIGAALEPLSVVTVGSLEDIGYEVDYDAADDLTMEAGALRPSSARRALGDDARVYLKGDPRR